MTRDHYTWLNENRAAVLREIHALHSIVHNNRQAIADDPIDRSLFGLLVGIAFSLWRAAFLTETTRAWPKILENAEAVLARLVEDNAINYPQDKNTREWTVGYYLNNARYRLIRVVEKLSQTEAYQEIARHPSVLNFSDVKASGGIDERDSYAVWEKINDVLVLIIHVFESKYGPQKASA